MEEGVLDVELVDRPVLGVSQGEDGADRGGLDDRAERLVIIHARPLGETTKDPMGLVSFQRTVGVELVLEDPFASDHVRLGRARDEVPGVVLQQGGMFFFHSPTPMWIGEGVAAGSRDR